jgi:molybdate transport system substrate-binding protein
MMKNKERVAWLLCASICAGTLAGCGSNGQENLSDNSSEPVTLQIAAAASLENCFTDKLIPMFEEEHKDIQVEGVYDSSGKLQTQLESGLQADLFFSAATQQMDALEDEGIVDKNNVVDLLENQLVLIVPKGQSGDIKEFTDIAKAQTVAIGDPESVPAGQYAKEALTKLGIWDTVSAKASYGTNVTEVLGWVESASAQAGLVYATDAASSDRVQVIAAAPEGSLETPVIYPVGLVASSKYTEQAQEFLTFLQSDEALDVFQDYGFTLPEKDA